MAGFDFVHGVGWRVARGVVGMGGSQLFQSDHNDDEDEMIGDDDGDVDDDDDW